MIQCQCFKNVSVIEGRASFVLLVFPHFSETGRHVFINWKLLDVSACPPHKALLCVQMGHKANFTDEHDGNQRGTMMVICWEGRGWLFICGFI